MEYKRLDDFDFTVTKEDILKRLHMPLDHRYGQTIDEMLTKLLPLAKPRALYYEAPIEAIGEDFVTIGGITFKSRILAKNLAEQKIVYPFLATSGRELTPYGENSDNMLDTFTVDAIMEALLRKATMALSGVLVNEIPKGRQLVSTNPGSLIDWPITEQKKMFEFFGEQAAALDVRLTESCLMDPVKSVSGIFYASAGDFDNCSLCQRQNCPTRKAPFDPELYDDMMSE